MNVVHHLDHAATQPLRPEARQAWLRAVEDLGALPGNPAALHAGGRRARRALEDARDTIAQLLGAERAEVVLTSGVTESDALAVAGGARGVRGLDPRRTHVLVSRVEHDAVGEQGRVLQPQGFSWDLMPLGPDGVTLVDEEALAGVEPTLALASLALVSSELGTVQPVAALSAVLRGAGTRDEGATGAPGGPHPQRPSRALVHTDAAQALTCLDVDVRALDVDLLSIGGHKIGAPVGTGALVVRRGVPLVSDRPGGGHERGLRSGTPDVAGACALAAALVATVAQREGVSQWASSLRERLLAGLPEGTYPTVPVGTPTVPTLVHLSLPTHHPEAVLLAMDAAGVLVSAGSACHAGVTRPSAQVVAMGRSEDEALGVLRVSTGGDSTPEDIDALLAALPHALEVANALDARDTRRRAHTTSRRSA